MAEPRQWRGRLKVKKKKKSIDVSENGLYFMSKIGMNMKQANEKHNEQSQNKNHIELDSEGAQDHHLFISSFHSLPSAGYLR